MSILIALLLIIPSVLLLLRLGKTLFKTTFRYIRFKLKLKLIAAGMLFAFTGILLAGFLVAGMF